MPKPVIKQVWSITIYTTKRQQVTFTGIYRLKLTEEATTKQIEKKIRKDFKKDLKKPGTIFNYERLK